MTCIYLDYAATTPVSDEAIAQMLAYLKPSGIFANPASIQHSLGEQAELAVESARAEIAQHLNAQAKQIIFTSGATESNNLAIKGIAFSPAHQGKHIITSATEHKSVLDCCKFLETHGFRVTYLRPNHTGLINLHELEAAVNEDTLLVSIMQVNNETGVIQNIQAIAEMCEEKQLVFHVDAAQSAGKLGIDLSTIAIDLLSFSGHKFYAPKGIGGLYIRHRAQLALAPLLHGGGQERGLRAGTLAVHQIVAMATAFKLQQQRRQADWDYLTQLRQDLLIGLNDLEGVHINGDAQHSVPHILNLSFEDVPAEALLIALRDEVAIASGSACNSGAMEASHVLRAMGIEGDRLYNAVRISFGHYTTEDEMKRAAKIICEQVQRLRALVTAI